MPNVEPWPVSEDTLRENPGLALAGLISAGQRAQAAADRVLADYQAQAAQAEPVAVTRAGRKGGFKSKLDGRAYEAAERVFAGVAASYGPGVVTVRVRYEPLALTLHVDGKPLRSYRPDLMVSFTGASGSPLNLPWLIEVKPRWNPKAGQAAQAERPNWRAHKSGRSSKLNLEHAAAEYAEVFRFFVLWPSKTASSGWLFEEIKADQ